MKNWIQDLTQVLDNLSKIADKNQSKHQSSYFYQYGINKILERKKIFIKIMILDLLRKKWKGLIYGGLYVQLKSFDLVPRKFNLVPKIFNLEPKKFNLIPKNFNFVQKKILFTAKNKLKLVPKKIQKITNRVDWTLCKRVCDMLPCLSLRLKSRMGNYPTITHTF